MRENKGPFYKTLYFWVLSAIVCGIALGHFAPEAGIALKPLGDGFIKLIKMMIAPVIFCTVVTGIAGMKSMKSAGRIGVKALVYFEAMTTFALLVGLAMASIFKPGAGLNIDPATLDAGVVAEYSAKAASQTLSGFVLGVIPDTLFDAFAKGEILQVLVVALLFAAGLMSLGEKGQGVVDFIQKISEILFKMIGFITKLAPLGAFGAMAFTVGKYGIVSLGPLLKLMLLFYATGAIFVFVGLGLVMRLLGLRLLALLRYLKEELFIVLGTSSSEAALPRLIEKMTALGCARSVVGMVIPTGYSFNLDGTCIYLTLAALFIAQALNIPLDIEHQFLLIGVLLLTSKGAAGVTGSGFIVLAATLSSVGHIPVAGLALILGIDRFMSEARAIVNIIGNAVATLVIARWENAMDITQIRRELARPHNEALAR